ncbi:MAG: GerMN domain-containing protein [Candidatus Acidiferrales bacterium]|jgi:sporulation and spore germination protein
MPRNLKITLGILSVAVLIGLISLRGLHQRIEHLSQEQGSEEQQRRELLKPAIATSTDVMVSAKLYWAAGPDRIAPVELPLPLSADPAKRGRQVLDALIADAPGEAQRTLPADATLLGFYILPDGTAIADFSEALASETPSGILSEEMAVDSIARTLESNVAGAHRLKILIHGQEVDTLAGHADLTGYFDLNPVVAAAAPAVPTGSVAPGAPVAPAAAPLGAPGSAGGKPSR